jgi:hypothetical protein
MGIISSGHPRSGKIGRKRPLWFMQSEREHIYQISLIVEGVAACLVNYCTCHGSMDYFEAIELVGRLEFAVDSMRQISGASQ